MKPQLTRSQRASILSGIGLFVTLLVVLQLWLLTATMNAYLGGDNAVVWPAAVASFCCLAGNVWLLRQLYYLHDRSNGRA